jgi:hypothetical protein
MGIEPTLAAWEAAVLPLNYTRTGENSRGRDLQTATRRPGTIADAAATPVAGRGVEESRAYASGSNWPSSRRWRLLSIFQASTSERAEARFFADPACTFNAASSVPAASAVSSRVFGMPHFLFAVSQVRRREPTAARDRPTRPLTRLLVSALPGACARIMCAQRS